MNKIIRLLMVIVLSVFILSPAFAQETEGMPEIEYAKGIVTQIISESKDIELSDALGSEQKIQQVEVIITSGSYKGKTVEIENQIIENPAYSIDLKKGDRVVIDIERENDSFNMYIADKERTPSLLIITGLFFLGLLLIGGHKGLNSLVSIVITAGLMFFVLIPLVLKGVAVLPLTILISILSTVATMFIVGGINKKSLSASIGTVLSLIFAGILSVLVIKFASLTGVSEQNSIILWTSRPDLDFTGILTSSMIIAALGAVMDVGMSIASCINELKIQNNSLNFKELLDSGMNVGKDIIGTMSNTLILAYIGGSMPLLLLASNVEFIKFLNLSSVVTEISAAIIGSIGIVVCVPITAVVASYLINKNK